jgi:hypothetical protein
MFPCCRRVFCPAEYSLNGSVEFPEAHWALTCSTPNFTCLAGG